MPPMSSASVIGRCAISKRTGPAAGCCRARSPRCISTSIPEAMLRAATGGEVGQAVRRRENRRGRFRRAERRRPKAPAAPQKRIDLLDRWSGGSCRPQSRRPRVPPSRGDLDMDENARPRVFDPRRVDGLFGRWSATLSQWARRPTLLPATGALKARCRLQAIWRTMWQDRIGASLSLMQTDCNAGSSPPSVRPTARRVSQ